MHKVSIIVPVYNTEKYLRACIESVLEQTYREWELILVNDGSKDDSEQICRTFAQADERITVLSQENRGVSAARNVGMAHATGEYITFLDSDDTLEPQALDVLVADIVEYGADISSATKSAVSADGSKRCSDNDGTITVYEGEDMLRRSLSYAPHTRSLHAQLLSAEFLKGITFTEGRHINEDGFFLFECYAKQPKVVQHNVSVYLYYFRENSSSNGAFSEKYFDMLYFCDRKFRYIREHMPQLLNEARNMEARTHLLFLQVLCRTGDKQYKDAEKASVKIVREQYRYYKPINKHHKMFAWIVAHGMYPLYKALFRMKFSR